jgi:hypothetical protein
MVAAASHLWFWQTPSWNWAEVWALLILLAVWALPITIDDNGRRAPLFILLLNGTDGRWSTSKAAAVLWTNAIWLAFIAILLHTNGKGVPHEVLNQQYLLLMGLPVGAAVVAKGITQSKVDAGTLTTKSPRPPQTNVMKGIGELVCGDDGLPDMLDFQYFGFNLVLLAYFFVQFLGNQQAGLPTLPDSLVALSGVSVASYIGKKGLQKDPQTKDASAKVTATPTTTPNDDH